MATPGSILPLVIRRSLAGKAMLAVIALGVFVAATLLASAPIYARAMADLGLTFTVREELSAKPSTRIQFRDVPIETAEGTARQAAFAGRIEDRLGWFQESMARHTQLGRFGIVVDNDAEKTNLFQAQPQSLPGYEAHVRVVEGALPGPSTAGQPLPLAISRSAAMASGLKVGEAIQLYETYDTCERTIPPPDAPPPPACTPDAGVSFTFPAVITGIVEPLDVDDPFWVAPVSSYFDPFRLVIPDIGPILPAFADERSITENFGASHPAYPATITWHVFADPERLTRANFGRATSDIEALRGELDPYGGLVTSPLLDTLTRFGRTAGYQQTPLTVLLLEITGIALFYVALVSAIVVERQAGEISLLRSRGASMWQIGTIYLLQGLLLGIPALLLAPFLAAASTALLGLSPTFHDVTDGGLLPVTIPPLAFVAGAAGVLLSLVALLIPALVVAKRSAGVQRRVDARPGVSILQRYYLDLMLAGAAALVLFELDQRGSAFEPSATGGLTSDPLLLASPALVIAAAGALVLRFYPLLLRFIARLVNAGAGASVSLGLVQVVRNSGQYTRLTLLLMMAVAVGTYAASYTSTTDRSYRDRASFETGADLRATNPGLFGPAGDRAGTIKAAAEIPGVEAATGVTRSNSAIAATGNIQLTDVLLGVDPAALGGMLWWRDDFADRPLRELLGTLPGANVVTGKALPGAPQSVSLWVKGTASHGDINLWVRLRDATGRYTAVLIDKLDTGGEWRQMKAAVPDTDLQPPLALVAVVFSEPSNRFATSYDPLYIDDITATGVDGNAAPVEDFEGTLRWSVFQSRTPAQDELKLAQEAPHGGRQAAQFSFRPGTAQDDTRGFYYSNQILPIPAIVSQSFANQSGLGVGGRATIAAGSARTLIPIQVQGIFKLFPTVGSVPAVVVDQAQLSAWEETAIFISQPELVPTEMLVSLVPGADEDAVVKALESGPDSFTRVDSRAAQLDRNRRNPLIAAGGSGILLVSFVAVLVLVAAALLVSLLTSLRRRRVEFAVARAMGITRGQILRMLALEYAVVAVAGVATGTLMGLVVGRRMLSFLDVTETGARVEPAFILETEWGFVAACVGAVLLVFAAALVLAVRVVSAIAGAQALRTE